MGKNLIEQLTGQSGEDKDLDYARALSAEQWQSNSRTPVYKDETGALVFNTISKVPATFAAFAGNHSFEAARYGYQAQEGLGTNGRTIGGLAVMFGANYLIDKAFFNDQTPRGGSLLGDFAAPVGIMFTPMAMRYKVVAGIAAHTIGKLLDKYGD